MCVIYACHSATPDKAELTIGAESNRDGAGIAWIDKFGTAEASVEWVKGLASTADAVLETIEEKKITYPFMIHYRTASIGGKTADLTHPFPITDGLEQYLAGSTRRVLMHNGHIGGWETWFKQIMFTAADLEIPIGPWSDSRALAAAVNVKGEGIIEFIRDSSRVAILDSLASRGCKKASPKSYIRLYGVWLPKEGWDQSCETRARCTVISPDPDDWRGGRKSSRHCSQGSLPTLEGKSSVFPTGMNASENTWTVDELEGLIGKLREEQNEARILLGV